MGGGGAEVGLTRTTLGHQRVIGTEPEVELHGGKKREGERPVDGSMLETQGDDSPALPILHEEVQSEVLDEIVAIIPANNHH